MTPFINKNKNERDFKLKYFIEYPIPPICNLHCGYCFLSEAHQLSAQGRYEEKYSRTCAFTPREFMAWRDKFIPSDEPYLVELHGGEPSCSQDIVFNVIDTLDKSAFQIQSNGLFGDAFLKGIVARKDKINRFGFTFHRTVINGDRNKIMTFESNVMRLDAAGIKVYVKELLVPECREEIIKNKKIWESQGIEFRVQNFTGYRGCEPVDYTPEDLALIHPEYMHSGDRCYCREGYKQVLIEGYNIFRGDVLACWKSRAVVGSITEDWYNADYAVARTPDGNEVIGVPQIYRGTIPKDEWTPENEKRYTNLTYNQYKQRSSKMSMAAVEFAKTQKEVLANEITVLERNRITYLQEVERIDEAIKTQNLNRAAFADEVSKISDRVRHMRTGIAAYDAVIAAANEAANKGEPVNVKATETKAIVGEAEAVAEAEADFEVDTGKKR